MFEQWRDDRHPIVKRQRKLYNTKRIEGMFFDPGHLRDNFYYWSIMLALRFYCDIINKDPTASISLVKI